MKNTLGTKNLGKLLVLEGVFDSGGGVMRALLWSIKVKKDLSQKGKTLDLLKCVQTITSWGLDHDWMNFLHGGQAQPRREGEEHLLFCSERSQLRWFRDPIRIWPPFGGRPRTVWRDFRSSLSRQNLGGSRRSWRAPGRGRSAPSWTCFLCDSKMEM